MTNPLIETTGPFGYRWQHPATGQYGRWCRSRAAAILDWHQRSIYCLMHS